MPAILRITTYTLCYTLGKYLAKSWSRLALPQEYGQGAKVRAALLGSAAIINPICRISCGFYEAFSTVIFAGGGLLIYVPGTWTLKARFHDETPDICVVR